MARPTAMVDAPMMALVLMCWLLIAAAVVVGILALANWLWKRKRP